MTWADLKQLIDAKLAKLDLTDDTEIYYIDLSQNDLSRPKTIDINQEDDGSASIY